MPASLNLPAAMWRGRNFYGALSEFSTPRVDARVLLFSLGICALTVLLFGLVPSLQATRVDITSALKAGTGSGTTPRGRRIDARRWIVGAETCLAMILLVAGGLLAANWRRFVTTDTGFDRSHLLTFWLRPSEVKYPVAKAPALYDQLLPEIERLPGVVAATVDGCAPTEGCANSTLYIMGRPQPAPGEAPGVLRHYIAPNHFLTLSIPVLRGRTFDARDRAGAPRVAIINQLAAQRFWPNEDPIGKRVWFGGGSNFNSPDSSAEIVGIVGDVAYQALDERPFQPDFYTPYGQFTYAGRAVLVRTRGEPAAMIPEIRAAIARVDPGLAMFDMRTMEEKLSASWGRLSYQTTILLSFAAIALLLAATGIFAIVVHVVSERRREIGIRIALGADHKRVQRLVVGEGVALVSIGAVIGLVGAILATRLLATLLFDVAPTDPATYAAILAVLAGAAVLASWIPARRASRVDPVEALRAD